MLAVSYSIIQSLKPRPSRLHSWHISRGGPATPLHTDRAAEQARIKGDLNSFAQIFGVKINLSNNLAVRNAVVDWIQEQLVDNFDWGDKVDVSEILIIIGDLMRQDAHKGNVTPLEQLAESDAVAVAQHIPDKLLREAVTLLDQANQR